MKSVFLTIGMVVLWIPTGTAAIFSYSNSIYEGLDVVTLSHSGSTDITTASGTLGGNTVSITITQTWDNGSLPLLTTLDYASVFGGPEFSFSAGSGDVVLVSPSTGQSPGQITVDFGSTVTDPILFLGASDGNMISATPWADAFDLSAYTTTVITGGDATDPSWSFPFNEHHLMHAVVFEGDHSSLTFDWQSPVRGESGISILPALGTPIPEPSVGLMAGLGLLLSLVLRRKRS